MIAGVAWQCRGSVHVQGRLVVDAGGVYGCGRVVAVVGPVFLQGSTWRTWSLGPQLVVLASR